MKFIRQVQTTYNISRTETLKEKVEYLLNKVATLKTSNQELLEEIRVLTEKVTRIKVP